MAEFRIAYAVLALVLAVSQPAHAEISYNHTTSDGYSILVVAGEFSQSDVIAEFERQVHRYNATVIVFDSPGGNLYKSMELGRRIRALDLMTFQPRGLECASACALAFMGGMHRFAMPGAIGVHRAYFGAGHGLAPDRAVQEIQALTADMISYMNDMGVDPTLLELSLRYSSDDIRYLSLSEMERFRVVTTNTDPQEDTNSDRNLGQQSEPQYENQVAVFVQSIIDAHTGQPAAALRAVAGAYASSVRYYGQLRTLQEVLADKRDYFSRWPERNYSVQPQSLVVQCQRTRCSVAGIYDWWVRSFARNKQASGTASFRYDVDMSRGMQIVGETSEVLSRAGR